jgi:hypothetical protein
VCVCVCVRRLNAATLLSHVTKATIYHDRPRTNVSITQQGCAFHTQVSADELLATSGFLRRPHGQALGAVKELTESALAARIDLTAELLSCGFIDTLVSALCAVEQLGAENVNGWMTVFSMMLLTTLDGAALSQIEDKLRAIPSALRYLKDSKISHIKSVGFSAGTFGTLIGATLYGKDEDNTFDFVREYRLPD